MYVFIKCRGECLPDGEVMKIEYITYVKVLSMGLTYIVGLQ